MLCEASYDSSMLGIMFWVRSLFFSRKEPKGDALRGFLRKNVGSFLEKNKPEVESLRSFMGHYETREAGLFFPRKEPKGDALRGFLMLHCTLGQKFVLFSKRTKRNSSARLHEVLSMEWRERVCSFP
jgi:hypothetical protein